MANVTKPMALDETLQGTNTALSGQNLKLEGIITKLQGIIAALAGNNPIIGDTDISGIADGTVIGAIDELNDDITNFKISDLHDIELTNPSDGEVLKYDATNQKWINGSGGSPIHSYSTSEQVVGTWIDGKPLYEKTINYTTPFNIGNGSWYTSTETYANCQLIEATIRNSTYAIYIGAIVVIENDKLIIGNQTHNQPMNNIKYVTIQYTKTTD